VFTLTTECRKAEGESLNLNLILFYTVVSVDWKLTLTVNGTCFSGVLLVLKFNIM